jgi:HD-GYP domain-containing protein (c-di-GMP phosphodiesterase class II)
LEERKAALPEAIREDSGMQFDPSIAALFIQQLEREGE